MSTSPFVYGTTVSLKSFTDREQETEHLTGNLLAGINTILISPRRWGKSSLVEKVIKNINLKNKQVKTVNIDLFSVTGEKEFLEVFSREVVKAASPKWQEWTMLCKTFFRQLVPKLTMGREPDTDFSVTFDWKELKKHSEEVLNLPERIARKKNIQFIICLDEFQNLATFPEFENLEKKMRSAWQRQKNVTYCLYGSTRHIMANIFNNPAKPFYRFGDIMVLPKIATEKWAAFISNRFKDTDKHISLNDAIRIPQLMKNHSWYVQQLAGYTWNHTKKTASKAEIKRALGELIQSNTPLYQNQTEALSATRLNLLKAVAKKETKFTSTAVMEAYQLGTPHNVEKSKRLLVNNDVIYETDGVFEFVDPAFELWFNQQYFNQPYSALV